MQLTPCPVCRRHVADAVCPFCAADAGPRGVVNTPIGRMSRAVVFAGAALASTACGGKTKPAEAREQREMPEEQEQNHPCSRPDPARIAELEKQKEAAQTEEEKAALDEQIREASTPMCAPYGAPPRRRRLV